MKSHFKNASKQEIKEKLLEMAESNYVFSQPILQGDTFWIYCNARRYWGTYKVALAHVGIPLEDDVIKSDYGFIIDWWVFKDSWDQKEYLAIILRHMYDNCIDISAHGLKNSPYFDIYTDAVLLFGRYDALLSYAEISRDRPERICYPENKTKLDAIVKMYLCDDRDKRCRHIQTITGKKGKTVDRINGIVTECPVIVDAANIAYVKEQASLENVRLVDTYLQKTGFPTDNIIFIFDAAFRYKQGINPDEFDELLHKDMRYSMAPAGEKADNIILTKAWELVRKNPAYPPIIITNDQYKDYFERHPEQESLRERKKGVTWTFILGKKEPVINLRDLEP
jgi:hypothetical protein